MPRRQHLSLTIVAVMLFMALTYFMSSTSDTERYPTRLNNDLLDHTSDGRGDSSYKDSYKDSYGDSSYGDSSYKGSSYKGSSYKDNTPSHNESPSTSTSTFGSGISESILKGGSIAPKLENATAKAELGRASWKLLHTMMARFPEKPTDEERTALKTYIQLFARLYPCGDCASHFQKLLERYPPQTSSRNAAAGWACLVHNEVNKRLHKKIFDCSKIGDFYDCGCGDEDKAKGGKKTGEGEGKSVTDGEDKEKVVKDDEEKETKETETEERDA